MSARQLQQPAPISATEYKVLGTSIMTTLAVLPQASASHEGPEPPVKSLSGFRKAFRNAFANTGLSRKKVKKTEPSDPSNLPGSAAARTPFKVAHPLLDVENISAIFSGLEVPAFVRPETRIERPNVAGIQDILETYDMGSDVEALIKKNFPQGDFQSQLFAYIKNSMKTYYKFNSGSLEARLMRAYATGLKEWCAAAHDLFISQMESKLRTPKSELALGTPRFYERAAGRQKGIVNRLAELAFEESPECLEQWRKFKRDENSPLIQAALLPDQRSREAMSEKGPHFISWLLRKASPELFLDLADDIAQTIRSFGGPSHLVNLIQHMSMHAEDVAEYEQMKRLVKGGTEAGFPEESSTSIILTADVPKITEYLDQPLRVLDPSKVSEDFKKGQLPPFLQLGHGLKEVKTDAVTKVIELYKSGEHDKASSVVSEEFTNSENFQAHLFGLLRKTMRSYAFVPKLSNCDDSDGFYPYELSTPLGELLHVYIEGLQMWCADVHEGLRHKFNEAVQAAYKAHTEEPEALIELFKTAEPAYTFIVSWLKEQLDVSSMPPPPKTSPQVDSDVAKLQANVHVLNWLIRNMPWDCFLFFRSNLATAVRELNKGKEGFSFLANVLESLSFTDRDAEEFKEYHNRR